MDARGRMEVEHIVDPSQLRVSMGDTLHDDHCSRLFDDAQQQAQCCLAQEIVAWLKMVEQASSNVDDVVAAVVVEGCGKQAVMGAGVRMHATCESKNELDSYRSDAESVDPESPMSVHKAKHHESEPIVDSTSTNEKVLSD